MKEKGGEPGGLEGIQKPMVTNLKESQSSCKVGQEKNTMVIAHCAWAMESLGIYEGNSEGTEVGVRSEGA